MNSSPLSYVRKGLCRCTLGIQGMPPRSTSSMLGCMAAVIAMVSPSQPSPAVIQRMWISVMGTAGESAAWAYSGELGMRFLSGTQTCPAVWYDALRRASCGKRFGEIVPNREACVWFSCMARRRTAFGLGQLEYGTYRGQNLGSSVWANAPGPVLLLLASKESGGAA